MPIDRTLWKSYFRKDRAPNWPCPKCGSGVIVLQEESFRYFEINAPPSKASEDWDETWTTYTYSAMFMCNNKVCATYIASCGRGGRSQVDIYEYEDFYIPEYFFPELVIFPIPKTCPQSVAEAITCSFQLFFANSASSANHIRTCIENILTDKGVKRFSNKLGKRRPINLHNRIVDYEKTNSEIAKRLLAIKWLGNMGSHSSELTKDDVLDAYEILDTVLDDLYVGQRKAINKKVVLINQRRRPLRNRQ